MSYSNAAGSAPAPSAAAPSASASTSRSRRELIDRVRYPNPIPLPPYPPKLVKIAAQPARYANPHFADRLASQQPVPVVVDVNAGMPIDLANFQNLWEGELSEVVVPASASVDLDQLDQADAFLLQDFAANLPASTAVATATAAIGLVASLKATDDAASNASLHAAIQQRHVQSLGPGAKAALAADDVTWLRRTEYLSAQHKNAHKHVHKPKLVETIDVSRDAQLAKIQKSFSDAQTPLSSLIHPNKKNVKALQAFDFLPDPETWATNYQVVRFIDPPGRILHGIPQPDPRLDVALFRPVTAHDGEQRVSYYLPSGEHVSHQWDAPMTLVENREIEDENARMIRKRRRTGMFPIPPNTHLDHDHDDQAQPLEDAHCGLVRKHYATAFKLSRDYVPKDTAETAHDVLILTFDDGIPDVDPDADIDPIKGLITSSNSVQHPHPHDDDDDDDEDDDLFGNNNNDNDDTTPNLPSLQPPETTLPPQSNFERQKRTRPLPSTKAKQPHHPPSPPKPRAYYHKIDMRFTLRVWRSRFATNEKLRNRDRRYAGKWDAIVLSHRELDESEKLRRLHVRSLVDDVGELQPEVVGDDYQPRDEVVEEESMDQARENRNDDEQRGADESNQDDDEEEEEEEEDEDEEEEEEEEDGSVDGDEELAALRAEAGEAGEDLNDDVETGARRSRTQKSLATSTSPSTTPLTLPTAIHQEHPNPNHE